MGPPQLFRTRALEHQRNRLLGDVLLTRGLAKTWVILPLFLILVAAGVWLVFADFARTVSVPGQVMAGGGQVKIFPPRSTVLLGLFVSEHDQVVQGQVLAKAGNPQLLSGRETREAALRRQLLKQNVALTQRLVDAKQEYLRRRQSVQKTVQVLAAARKSLYRQQALVASREIMKRRQLADTQRLARRGFLAAAVVQQQRDQLLELSLLAEQLQERVHRQALDLEQKRLLQQELPLEFARVETEIEGRQAELEFRLAQLKNQEQFLITAPRSGSISSLQADTGDRLSPSEPLLTILGKGGASRVLLFVGSRVIGTLEAGQKVLLKYASFPYRKFGSHAATVRSIDGNSLVPSEIQSEVALRMALKEPVYRVEVVPQGAFVGVDGREIPLTIGMELTAEIELDKRPLWQWLLDPLLSWRSA